MLNIHNLALFKVKYVCEEYRGVLAFFFLVFPIHKKAT